MIGATTPIPVSIVFVQPDQANPPMSETMHRKVAARRTVPPTLPSAVNETGMVKTTQDEQTSNDCSSYHQLKLLLSSYHHGDFKAAEPRDDSNEEKVGSKHKQLQDESSPPKYRYSVFWV